MSAVVEILGKIQVKTRETYGAWKRHENGLDCPSGLIIRKNYVAAFWCKRIKLSAKEVSYIIPWCECCSRIYTIRVARLANIKHIACVAGMIRHHITRQHRDDCGADARTYQENQSEDCG